MVKKGLLYLIEFYQRYISPLKGPTCKYYPTCSQYAKEAISMHGPFRGAVLSVWRILRCNPFSHGGYDPVPLPMPLRKAEGVKPRRFGRCHT